MTTTSAATGRALEPAPFIPIQTPTGILIDLFPAAVTLPAPTPEEDPDNELATTLNRTRMIITATPNSTAPGTLYVFTDSAVGPALVYSAPFIQSRDGSNREGSITTPEGETITYAKESGCGCGSALKSFQPFSHPYSVA